jgi:O-antigen ligase
MAFNPTAAFQNNTSFVSSLLLVGAFVASLYFNGIHLQYYSIAMVLIFCWLLVALISGYHHNSTFYITPLMIALWTFLVFLLVSLLYHPVPYLGMINLWWVGIFVVISTIYMLSPKSEQLWTTSIVILMVISLVLAGYGLLQNLLLRQPPEATFYNKNSLAALINLAVFPLAALSFSLRHSKLPYFAGMAILLLSFVLGIIASRGALLAFAVAYSIMIVLAWRQVARKNLMLLTGIISVGFALAIGYDYYLAPVRHEVLHQLASLTNPEKSGNPRFLLWQPAWDLLREHPWQGIGLGAFFLKLPASQLLQDKSAGYYVHNDYLQIATETGLPGLFFLLLVIAVLMWQFRQYLRSNPEPQYRLESVGLFAAVFSLGVHSLFTYNLYLMPLMMIAGFYLARLNQLYVRQNTACCISFDWRQHFRRFTFYAVSIVLSIVAMIYFFTLALSDYYHHKAVTLSAAGQLQKAHLAFESAQLLSPRLDLNYYDDARLLLGSAAILPEASPQRRDLLRYAAHKLDVAARLNPYQPYTPYLQGSLTELESSRPEDAVTYYQQSLIRNPRFLPARLALARLYQREAKTQQSFSILSAGLDYSYQSLTQDLLDYIQLTADTADALGQDELAVQLHSQHEKFLKIYRQQQQTGQNRLSQKY